MNVQVNHLCSLVLLKTFYNLPRQKAVVSNKEDCWCKYALHSNFYNSLNIRRVTIFKEIFLSF